MKSRLRSALVAAPLVLAILLMTSGTASAQGKTYTLKQCIDKVLKTNLALIQTKDYFRQAKADVLAAKGAFLPRLDWRLSGYYNHNKWTSFQDPVTGQFVPGSYTLDTHGYSTSLEAGMTLFDGLGNYFNLRQSQSNRDSYAHKVSQRELEAVYNVKSQYFNLLKAQRIVMIAQKALERTQELMKIAETKYELGSASRSDVLKAKVSLSQAQLELLTAENSVSRGQASLNYAIGEPVDQALVVDDVEIPEIDYSQDMIKDAAMSSNPEYLSAVKELQSARFGLKLAWSYFMPKLTIGASKDWSGPELGEMSDWWSRNYTNSIGATLSFNIFSGFQTKRLLDNAKANLHSSEYGLSDAKRSVELEVRESYLNLQETIKSRELAVEKLASAQEDYKLAQEKYTLGAATILDILDAEVSLREAESDQIESKYSYLLAVARLKTVMGIID